MMTPSEMRQHAEAYYEDMNAYDDGTKIQTIGTLWDVGAEIVERQEQAMRAQEAAFERLREDFLHAIAELGRNVDKGNDSCTS